MVCQKECFSNRGGVRKGEGVVLKIDQFPAVKKENLAFYNPVFSSFLLFFNRGRIRK